MISKGIVELPAAIHILFRFPVLCRVVFWWIDCQGSSEIDDDSSSFARLVPDGTIIIASESGASGTWEWDIRGLDYNGTILWNYLRTFASEDVSLLESCFDELYDSNIALQKVTTGKSIIPNIWLPETEYTIVSIHLPSNSLWTSHICYLMWTYMQW